MVVTDMLLWSQMARWTQYPDGFDLVTIAGLADLTKTDDEPAPILDCESVDRAVESLCCSMRSPRQCCRLDQRIGL